MLLKYYNNKYNIEYTVHKCPSNMKKDIQSVFKNDIKIDDDLLLIPTWQKSSLSLLEINDNVSIEMDRLFLNFKNWLLPIKKIINENNKWLDASCPFTGKALFGTPSGFIYNELDGLTKLLKYDNDKIGCCGMVYHPEFKDRSYPITVFTNMEFDKLKDILI